MPNPTSTDSAVTSDPAVEKFFAEYSDPNHAVFDWRLGYSVVERLMGPLTGRMVLDYGCGNGRFTRLLRDRGAAVTGVDISAEAIDQARQADSRQITYHVIDSGDLSMVPPGSIDIVVSTLVLCCVRERVELDRILAALCDRLRPGGGYVLAEPHPDAVSRQFYSMVRTPAGPLAEGVPLEVRVLGGCPPGFVLHDFWHSKDAYLDLLRQAGFTVEQVIESTMNTYPNEPQWKDERSHPPFVILKARKQGD